MNLIIDAVKRKADWYRDRANGRVSAHMPEEAQVDWEVANALEELVPELEALVSARATGDAQCEDTRS